MMKIISGFYQSLFCDFLQVCLKIEPSDRQLVEKAVIAL